MNVVEALEARRARLPAQTDAFRWVDEELRDVTVDLFGDVAILSVYRAMAPEEERGLAEQLAAARSLRAVYLKRRPREARHAGEHSEAVAPRTPLVGAPVEPFVVQEQGARFEIRPDNGLSVGLYLDARDARAWVRAHSQGSAVLNLFAYTCGFGVAAGLGGAPRVVNVDTSRRVLEWGERNAQLNRLGGDRVGERAAGLASRGDPLGAGAPAFVVGDAFDWLRRLARRGERFDLVVLDPPGFATTKKSRFTAARDYHRLVEAAARAAGPGALMLAMCNVEALSEQAFEAQLARGLGSRRFRTIERFGASEVDFRRSRLQCVALELG